MDSTFPTIAVCPLTPSISRSNPADRTGGRRQKESGRNRIIRHGRSRLSPVAPSRKDRSRSSRTNQTRREALTDLLTILSLAATLLVGVLKQTMIVTS